MVPRLAVWTVRAIGEDALIDSPCAALRTGNAHQDLKKI